MHRLIVALLAALDAAIAAAAGIAVALAPLTLLWVFGLGAPVWSALWPASAAVWQLGHLVPQSVQLPAAYLAATGIPAEAASFTLSLAPLAFASFTAVFAARSGRRAAQAGAWGTGIVSGVVVFAVVAAGVWATSRTPIAAVHGWQAILFPVLVFAIPALIGAVATAWIEGDGGIVDRVHDRVDDAGPAWRAVPGLVVRGTGLVLTGLIGLGALAVVVALVGRGGEVIALYEAGHMDVIGVIVVSLGQFAYLPTLVVWGLSYVAGPGFAVGAGTAVSPSGTQLGVVPGIPVLGALPETSSPWLLVVVVLPVAVAAFAGWAVRSRLVSDDDEEPIGARLVLAAGIALLSAAGAALLAAVASGSLGPDRLGEAGPAPGPVALSVGVEVLVGVAILLLSPRREGAGESERPRAVLDADAADPAPSAIPLAPLPLGGERERVPVAPSWRVSAAATGEDERETAPIDAGLLGPDGTGGIGADAAATADDTETAPIDPGFLGAPDERDR